MAKTLTIEKMFERLEAMGHKMPESRSFRNYIHGLTRSGAISPPERGPLQDGRKGKTGYYDEKDFETISRLFAAKSEVSMVQSGYSELIDRAQEKVKGRLRRFAQVIWVRSDEADALESAADSLRISISAMFRLGARLYHEAPAAVRTEFSDALSYQEAIADDGAHQPNPQVTAWGRFATRYAKTVTALQDGCIPFNNPSLIDTYLFWHAIQNEFLTENILQALHIKKEDILRHGEVVGNLTTFSERVRLFRPTEGISQDENECTTLAKELGAVLVTGEGRDFNHATAAEALGRVGDWMRGVTHGTKR